MAHKKAKWVVQKVNAEKHSLTSDMNLKLKVRWKGCWREVEDEDAVRS